MCGIAGLCNWGDNWQQNIERMNEKMYHRGPDAAGVWASDDRTVAFGHRRLSIVDLTPSGAQPMESHNGRYVMVYNGEIYNHQVIRDRLIEEKRVTAFRGTSDTEVPNAVAVNHCDIAFAWRYLFAALDEYRPQAEFYQPQRGEKSCRTCSHDNYRSVSRNVIPLEADGCGLRFAVDIYLKSEIDLRFSASCIDRALYGAYQRYILIADAYHTCSTGGAETAVGSLARRKRECYGMRHGSVCFTTGIFLPRYSTTKLGSAPDAKLDINLQKHQICRHLHGKCMYICNQCKH